MNGNVLFIILIFFFLFKAEGQNLTPTSPDVGSSFKPSVAVVVGVLSIMFALTFLLLIYAKFCHNSAPDLLHNPNLGQPNGLVRSRSRFSGIDKNVIDSLPFFRFSSLRGSKDGLECAVCLSKFEETETLRLLPKCKHAFHVNCVDKWLESHSSCPLCRLKVDAEDITIYMYSSSMRVSRTQSDLSEDPNLELFVRREPEDRGSSRFSVGSSFRKMEDVVVLEEGSSVLEEQEKNGIRDNKVSEVVKNRWSDVNSADLLFLNSQMLSNGSKEEVKRKKIVNGIERSYSVSGSRLLIPTEKRSMTEIVSISRFVDHFDVRNRSNESSGGDGSSNREEILRKLWSPVARRTVEWFAGRERRAKQSQYSRQLSIV